MTSPSEIYLDHAATTPVHPEVVEAMLPFLQSEFANPSSLHVAGRRVRKAVEAARAAVAGVIGSQTKEVVFTGGGTESDTLALLGVATHRESANGCGHIVTTAIEHPAILSACKLLERRGHRITYVRPGMNCRVAPEKIEEALEDDTFLVSVMLVNNETGTLQPLREIAEVAHARGALVHSDGVQAVGKMPVNVADLGVDLFSFAAHKFNGPKGVGALWVREGVEIVPLAAGGKQERGLRGGTENTAGIVGMGKAAELLTRNLAANLSHVRSLRERLLTMTQTIPSVRLNGDRTYTVPHIMSLCLIYVDALLLQMNLSQRGIYISVGSACASGKLDASYVLKAAGMSDFAAFCSVRFSLGPGNTAEEIDSVLPQVAELAAMLRQVRAPEEIGVCDDNCPCLWDEAAA